MRELLAIVLVLAAGGCGGHGETERTRVGERRAAGGDTALPPPTSVDAGGMTVGAGAGWPAALPAYVPAYPGSALVSAISGTSKSDDGAMITFSTTDAPAKVTDFYIGRARAAGLRDTATMSADGHTMVSASEKGSGRSVTVQTSVQEGRTLAVLLVGTKRG